MFWIKQIVIGDGERGLLYRNRQLQGVLSAGVYRYFDPLGRIAVVVHNVSRAEYAGADAEVLMAQMGAWLAMHFLVADVGTGQVGLVLKNGKLEDVLAPGTRKLYWKDLVQVELRLVSLADTLELEADVASRLRQLCALGKVAVTVEVPVESAGLLFVDGKLVRTLAPGAYAFWNFQRNVVAEVIDQRVQSLEVSGQELLTRDKVSLRVNLAASLRVTDPVAARTKVTKYSDYLYRELQYGLRKAVSAKTLDELLGDKASLDADIFAYVYGRVGELGLEVLGVGVKDVILPGEMKDILNSVVQAEKAAQANVIRRREEANATRSLLNTARLIEESPVLMRLKELEALEKVTEKIDKLTVFGGLDGVLKQLVTLKE
ncbi:slipin family protein [Dyella koreensis]|uniref:Slipin family protein n=1 Tax=Dyella koreensis TaxID=311235 RepID=A0ABW8K5C8_9GAMM